MCESKSRPFRLPYCASASRCVASRRDANSWVRRTALAVAGLLLCSLAASGQPTVQFALIDAATDQELKVLADGDVVDLNALPQGLAVRADAGDDVGSVRFRINDNRAHITESVRPFALHGDSNGDYRAWTPAPGAYRISATPFSEPRGAGRELPEASITIRFTGTPNGAQLLPDVAGPAELPPVTAPVGGTGEVSGDLKQWHKTTITLVGPESSETASPNPFLHYRLLVTFTQGDQQFIVPGHFAGDGKGGAEGDKWQVHFSPPQTGEWRYRAAFHAGYQINVGEAHAADEPTACHGAEGTFQIAESDKSGADFRSPRHGLIKNRGAHYLTYGGSGAPWIKCGPDIPENFLGYEGFDNTPRFRHQYAAHRDDWRQGDPDWGDGQGRNIIGALNYIAEQGGNCLYFLPMNLGGDGKDTFPTISEVEKLRLDLSKLQQWEAVFAHAQSLGIFLHFQLAETEDRNENFHDEGQLGVERKFFYRQLLSRFAHHNAIEFDLGEENDYGTERRKQFARYLKSVDPYDHPVTTHTHGGQYDQYYEPLLGNDDFDITAFQGGDSQRKMYRLIARWREKSAAAGVPWAISFDEPQKIENDPRDDKDGYAHGRRNKMWPALMAGGAGFEWYVQQDGSGHGLDHRLEDFREMRQALQWCRHAREFLLPLPLLEMNPADGDASAGDGNAYVFSAPNRVYAVYFDRSDGPLKLNLSDASGQYAVGWFNPREGGPLRDGSVRQVVAGDWVELGAPPADAEQDWACVVRKEE